MGLLGGLLSANGNYLEVFEYYFSKFGNNTIEPIIWAEFSIAMVIGFIIRGYALINFEMGKINKKDENAKKKVMIYCGGHVAYEFLIGYIICFCLINFTNANPNAFFINTIICPAVGFIVGMVFDNKIIMKLEESNNIGNMSKEMEKDRTNIEITAEKNIKEIQQPENGVQKINLNTVESCDIKLAYRIITTINSIIDEYGTTVNNLNEKIEILERIIKILRESEKNDKKIELKSLIYKCLNEGYAKPEEDAVITCKYNAYLLLLENEDSEIKSLYENRYLKLGVHEDRRINKTSVENDRRTPKRVKYGEYDNESQG